MATPADLTGKQLWLRAKDLGASGASVTTWSDQSGKGNNGIAQATPPVVATGATPAGGKAVEFNSNGSFKFTSLDTVSGENPPDEAATKLFDGSASTKWLTSSSTAWVIFTTSAPVAPATYTITSGNDAPERDPKAWTLHGWDGTSWVVVDSRSNEAWSGRGQARTFTVTGSATYSRWKWDITQNNGGSIFQCAEFSLPGVTCAKEPIAASEVWVVVKPTLPAGNGNASVNRLWNFSGAKATDDFRSLSSFPDSTDGSKTIIDNFGRPAATRQIVTAPSSVLDLWHLYRISTDGTGWRMWLDGTTLFTGAATAISFTGDMLLGDSAAGAYPRFKGQIAELLIRHAVSSPAEVADLITYFNTEHGLTVPGGSAPGGTTGTVKATAPTPTLAISGTVPAVGQVAATAPATTLAVTGTASGLTTGTMAATGPAPAVNIAGDVSAPVSGTVAAIGPVPTLKLSEAPGLTLAATAGSSTQILAVTITTPIDGFTAPVGSTTLIGAAGILVITPTVGIHSATRCTTRIRMPRDWGEDPRTGRPAYKVRIVTRDGAGVVELDKVTIGVETEGRNTPDSWSFTVARANKKAQKVMAVAHQAQLWRGKIMLTKGDITPGRVDGSRITYEVKDPSAFLFGKRVIGRIPKRQLLRNHDFAKGLAYWTGAYGPDSALKAPPTARIVDDPYALSGKAIELGAVDKVVTTKVDVQTSAVFVPNKATYLSGGEQKIKDVGANIPEGAVVRLTGYTANDGTGNGLALSLARAQAAKATLAAMGKKFVFKMPSPLRTPNVNDGTVVGRGYYEQIPGGLAPNRRVSIAFEGTQTATGHNQFERQLLTITQPVDARVPLTVTLAGDMRIIRWDGAPKNGYAMRLILHPLNNLAEDKIVDEETRAMDEATPRVRWAHYEASIEVPADGKPYTLEVQFQPPAGLARWANLGLWPHDQLGFFDVDQAIIVKALVEHAQDAAMGKGNLGIGTRTPLTGVPRTKEYPFHERMPVGTALEWFTSIAHGVDIDCETTETSATIVTHFPQQGAPADIALVHGGKRSNVVDYKPLATSRRDLASSIIMQADGSGASRPEAYASDRRALGGTLLESVVSAEGETPLSELQEGADVALAQSLNPRPGWEVSLDAAWTTRLLDEVHKGDIVRLVLPDEGVDGPYRVEERQLDPGTDRIRSMTLVEA